MDRLLKIKLELSKWRGSPDTGMIRRTEEEIKGIIRDITSDDIKKLLEDGFLEQGRDGKYRIMDSRDMIIAKETLKAGEETKKLTMAMLIFTVILIILTIIHIGIVIFKL